MSELLALHKRVEDAAIRDLKLWLKGRRIHGTIPTCVAMVERRVDLRMAQIREMDLLEDRQNIPQVPPSHRARRFWLVKEVDRLRDLIGDVQGFMELERLSEEGLDET